MALKECSHSWKVDAPKDFKKKSFSKSDRTGHGALNLRYFAEVQVLHIFSPPFLVL